MEIAALFMSQILAGQPQAANNEKLVLGLSHHFCIDLSQSNSLHKLSIFCSRFREIQRQIEGNGIQFFFQPLPTYLNYKKMGKSSKDKRDIYYRLAKEKSYRARSAFKLIQLNSVFDLFKVERAVDLCSTPGSWSQVLSENNVKVLAVDLMKMEEIEGVEFMQGDITREETILGIVKRVGKVGLVVCDG